MLHLHLTAIIVSFILFIAVYFMYKKNNTAENKPAFIMHMVLRVFYACIIQRNHGLRRQYGRHQQCRVTYAVRHKSTAWNSFNWIYGLS